MGAKPDLLEAQIETLETEMRRVMWLEQKRMAHLLAGHRLTVPQFWVLATLAARDHGCAIGALADEMMQSYPTMTGIIDRLEKDHLVERRRGDSPDRRQVTVGLTGEGRALLERAERARNKFVYDVLSMLPERDLSEFLRLLKAYLQAFQSQFEKEHE